MRIFRRSKNPEKIFTRIYRKNAWRGENSVSGTGSEGDQTRKIERELSVLIRKLDVAVLLDIPCGDFHWMKNVELRGIDYIGADIVAPLVRKNREKFGTAKRRFEHLNLIGGQLPKADLVVCRDCLVHLSFQDAFRALKSICESGSEFLLTTTFPERAQNPDIETGSWRPLNLEIEPFEFPTPLRIISEGCTENEGVFADKSLGLWKIADLNGVLDASRD